MTAKINDRIRRATPNPLPPFQKRIDTLPLLCPTRAAALAAVRRHSLACYRSRGEGPAYYKFGKWIFYHVSDVAAWTGNSHPCAEIVSLRQLEPPKEQATVEAFAAAAYLHVTRFWLTNARNSGVGPPFIRLGRRYYYISHDLWDWACRQRIVPSKPLSIDTSPGRSY